MIEAITRPTPSRARTFSLDLPFLIQVSRPGLWTTTALFYLMPLGSHVHWRSAIFWVGLFYVLLPLGLLLYGANDIVDAQTDSLNPRKGTFLFGSRGGPEQLAALRWQIGIVQIPFLVAFFLLVGPRILWWAGLLLVAVGVYNLPRFGWKGRPPFDVLIQSSYLLIFVLSSWLNHTSQLPWPTFLFGALFAMHSHIFGEVMDIDPDRLSGRRTTATVLGRVSSKTLMAVFLCVEAAIIFYWFQDRIIAGFLALGAAWFLGDAVFVWKERAYRPRQMRLFMWSWNAVAVTGIVWNWMHSSLTSLHASGKFLP